MNINVLQPKYYDRFSCIGGACEDNCCKDWGIQIDKNTFMKYRRVKDPAFQEMFSTGVKRIRGPESNDLRYAQFVLNEGRCPFQQESGLCEIHATLGPDYLCHTCQIYPRTPAMTMDKLLELSLTMSCPEVVRVALMDENSMTFEMVEKQFVTGAPELRSVQKTVAADGKPDAYTAHAWTMREGCIDLLQDRQYTIAQRILIIGMLLKKCDELYDAGQTDDIPGTVQTYVEAAQNGQFTQLLQDLDNADNMAVRMSGILLGVIMTRAGSGTDSYQPLSQFMQAFRGHIKDLGLEDGTYDINTLAHAFLTERTGERWNRFLKKRQHVLENYFVNFVFSKQFPFTFYPKGMRPYHHFIVLAEQYAMLRLLLCVNADEENGVTDTQLIHTITAVSSINQHSQTPVQVSQHYIEKKVDALPLITFLLCDY